MLITSIIGYFYFGKSINNYLCSRALGIVYALVLITAFFYTYTGILGTSFSIINIASFFISVFIGEYLSFKKMISFDECTKLIPIILLSVLLLAFIIFTYIPPKINYFRDPISNTYGIIP